MAGECVTSDAATYPRGFASNIEWPWPLVPARNLVTLNYGRALRADIRRAGYVPVFGTNGQCGWHDAPLTKGPGLILGRKGQGPLGVEWCNKDFWVIDTAYFASTLTPALELKYLYHLVKYIGLNHLKDGTSNPTLSRDSFGSQLLPLPPTHEQRAIVHILGTLDDKIELNRRMNETLEGMARAIFKSWFVDFDPVRAKADELCNEGLLEIGDGYRAKNSEMATEGLPFVRAGNLNAGFDFEGAERLGYASVAKAQTKLSKAGDVAFTSKGTVGRTARVHASTPQFVYAPQICFWRSTAPDKLHPSILYCWMLSDDFGDQVRSFSAQTDMAPYISLRDQRGIYVPRFPVSQELVGSRIDALLDRQAACISESRTLAKLRDSLLPKLLSGAIRVPEAEKLAEAAV